MIFFLFVTFITVSGIHVSHTAQLENLLATEPASVEKILEMIAELRQDNVDTMAKVTAEKEDAQTVNDHLQGVLKNAIAAEELALGHVRDATNTLNDLIVIENQARAVEKKAKEELDAAQLASDRADAFLAEENVRIDEERDTCQQIIVLLSKLAETAEGEFLEIARNHRRLLSVIDLSGLAGADPDSIKEVEDMIHQLIDDGEAERLRVMQLAADADAELQKEIAEHNVTLNALYWAAGDVEVSTEKLNELTDIGEKATAATTLAQLNADNASDILNAKVVVFDFEKNRVEEEEKVFVEVTNLLQTLK